MIIQFGSQPVSLLGVFVAWRLGVARRISERECILNCV